jgi:dienelactone hydrolase
MRIFLLLLGLIILPLGGEAGEMKSFRIKTPRGAEVEVLVAYPTVRPGEKVPAIVAAPGQGYHMGLPIFAHLREKASAAGIAVFTFHWNFFSEGKKRHENFDTEVEDMQAVLHFARADERVDASRIILAGKSIGSVVVYRVFRQNPDAYALHLWTPLFYTAEIMDTRFAGLASVAKPVLVLAGAADEAFENSVALPRLAAAGRNIAVVQVPGAHSFELGPHDDPNFTEKNERNVSAVMDLAVHWMRVQLGN